MSETQRTLLPVEPEGWKRGRGYSHGIIAPAGGRLLFVAGQIGWDETESLVGDGFAAQFERALENVATVVQAAGGSVEHIGRLTVYVTDRDEYVSSLAAVGQAYQRVMGGHYPAMALVAIRALVEPLAKVEIAATAVLPATED